MMHEERKLAWLPNRDGWLCEAWTFALWERPVLRTCYYPIRPGPRKCFAELIGLDAVPDRYEPWRLRVVPPGYGPDGVTLTLADGAATPPMKTTEAPWPCPLDRGGPDRGLQTRYGRGAWQKFEGGVWLDAMQGGVVRAMPRGPAVNGKGADRLPPPDVAEAGLVVVV